MKLQNLKRINQDIKDLKNPLEHLKVASALNSELFKLDYRITNKPNDISPLDYTIIMALDRQIPKKPKCYEDKFIHCPNCGIGFGYKWECYPTKENDYSHIQYCFGCGQKILWEEDESEVEE